MKEFLLEILGDHVNLATMTAGTAIAMVNVLSLFNEFFNTTAPALKWAGLMFITVYNGKMVYDKFFKKSKR